MAIIGRANETQERRSALFNYYCAREGSPRLEPISIRAALRSAQYDGICRDALHPPAAGPLGPYVEDDARMRPSSAAEYDALDHRLVDVDPNWNTLGYYTLDGADTASNWRSALGRGIGIVAGFYVSPAYEAITRGESTRLSATSADRESGHVVAVVGFDREWFTIRDSLGTNIGEGGHWWVHERVIQRDWVAESWAVAALETT